jgi:hypothetical protein
MWFNLIKQITELAQREAVTSELAQREAITSELAQREAVTVPSPPTCNDTVRESIPVSAGHQFSFLRKSDREAQNRDHSPQMKVTAEIDNFLDVMRILG